MNKQKVYVVTVGEYSDYHIVGIFSTREKAEEYVNHSGNYELNDIDEVVLDELEPSKGRKLFYVDSDLRNIDCRLSCDYGALSGLKDLFYIYSGMSRFHVRLSVEAETREQAVKIAAERIRLIKAEERIRFPLLRVNCEFYSKEFRREMHETPVYHYHTGEIVLPEYYELQSYTIPESLEGTVKTVTREELKNRQEKEVQP